MRVCENISEPVASAFFTRGESRGYSHTLGPATNSSHTLSLLQNYKHAVTPAEAGVQKPLTSLDSCFRRNDRKKQV